MAERRMFSRSLIDSDAFLDMPLSAQALYFHLGMQADDEGFVNNPKKIQRSIGAANEDMRCLINTGYIIPFESGIIVITHWHAHNSIRSDRLRRTQYQQEASRLIIENDAYKLCDKTARLSLDNQLATTCQPSDNQMTAQDRLGKDSIGKGSIGQDSPEKKSRKDGAGVEVSTSLGGAGGLSSSLAVTSSNNVTQALQGNTNVTQNNACDFGTTVTQVSHDIQHDADFAQRKANAIALAMEYEARMIHE